MKWRVIPGLAAGAGLVSVLGVALATLPGSAIPGGGPPSLEAEVAADPLAHPYDGRFTFVRIRFQEPGGFGGFRRRLPAWAHDYPRADRNFMRILEHITYIPSRVTETNVLDLDDPALMHFPVAYLVEPGFWNPTDAEVAGLREYLLKGGFLILDDFGGPRDWRNVEYQMGRVVPELRWHPVDGTHSLFQSFFQVDHPENLLNYRGIPEYYVLFEGNDPSRRVMVIANHNNDIGEFWEYSDVGYFPVDLSNKAYQIGVNYILYALTR